MSKNSLPTLYQDFIHLSRYSRWLEDEGRRETWNETVARYFDFFEEHLKEKYNFDMDRSELEQAVLGLEVMPSMRALMTAGPALKRDHIAGYNCSYIPIDRATAFDEILYVLMCFAPETRVLTKDGPKKFCEITVYDYVLSLDVENKIYEYIQPSLVTETESSAREKIELEFEDGYTVRCTSDHKFLTKNRGWVEAKDLTEDDDIENFHEID